MKFTVMGCGSSFGMPEAGNVWGACDPAEPRNRRTRSSLLVQSAMTTLVVDGGCDLRAHLNLHNVRHIDGMLITHAHADHIHGIDDLRPISYLMDAPVKAYASGETFDEIRRRWPYMFEHSDNGIYKSFIDLRRIGNYGRFTVGDIDIDSFDMDHVSCTATGFRFGGLAYSADVRSLNEKSLAALKDIDTWIVDAAAYKSERVRTHATLAQVMEWVGMLKPRMTYLTVLSREMDYKTLCDELPPHIRPAYDGLEIML